MPPPLSPAAALFASAALMVPSPAFAETEAGLQLVTARASAEIVQPGRVLMEARGNRWIYDSVPPLGGPNEEVNPLDGMLSALASCGMYVYEAAGIENGIEITNLSATVEGAIDPRGVAGAPVNPRVRAFAVTMQLDGPTPQEATMLANAFAQRCPIYTTLALSADIEVRNVIGGAAQEPITTSAAPIVEKDIDGEMPELGRPSAQGRMIEFGRSLMMARGNRWLNDSVPPLGGPNEEINPLDMFVGALPACGLMVYEAVAREQGIPLHAAKASVEADLDPRGVAGADVNPRIRAFRVAMQIDGPTPEEAAMMADAFAQRCPIYTTYERAAPIEVTHVGIDDLGVILEIDFTYDFASAEDYVAEVSPLAEAFAAVDGLRWKAWTLNEDQKRAGGILMFDDEAARAAFLESDLAAAVTTHPALSAFRVQGYDVMGSQSLVTNGPVTSMAQAGGDGLGTMLQINFTYNVPTEDYIAAVSPLADQFAAADGLRWKIWALDPATSQFSGILLFETPDHVALFAESDLARTVMEHPALSDFSVMPYAVLGAQSLVTRAPVGSDES